MNRIFAIKGTFLFSLTKTEIGVQEGFLLSKDGISQGIVHQLPLGYEEIPVEDYTGHLIIPGLSDIHLHGPQHPIRGTGMDLELLDWLNTYTFPQEARYESLEYAETAYREFVGELRDGFTTRACIYGTIHKDANLLLMDLLEESGLITCVGKVNMDRNSPPYLIEKDAGTSLMETREWLDLSEQRYVNTKPMLTPRFIPTCTDELLLGLGKLKEEYHVAYQSHLAENPSEIQWVKELCPDANSYTDAYHRRNAFGPESQTIMAHCVYLSEAEQEELLEYKVFVAHCPDSNINLSSGIAPIRKYLNKGLRIGLGSDIAGGSTMNMFQIIKSTIQSSKMYWRLVDQNEEPLTLAEAFYLATRGGGEFFGKVGSFEPGYEVDAIVLKEENLTQTDPLKRLERLIYEGDYHNIEGKYVKGQKII